jgi:predicted N-acetyltransferase YhbS
MDVAIRPVEPDEFAQLGALTVASYIALDGYARDPDYEVELYDVRSRAEAAATVVLVAVDDEGTVLGGVTFVEGRSSPYFEHEGEEAASIRMLAVDPSAQGRGVGEALARACVERARELGCGSIVLHSTAFMPAAHRLYERLGFTRDPGHDVALPALELLAFRLDLA